MKQNGQNFTDKREEVLSRFSNDFRKMYLDGNLLAHTVIHHLANDISSEQLLEHLIIRDTQRQKITEDLISLMPAPPIIISKEHWDEVKKTFPNQKQQP